MIKMKVRKTFDYDPQYSWKRGNPFTITFIYPKSSLDSKFIVKGGCKDVENFLDLYKIPFIGYKSFWYRGSTRGYWFTNIEDLYFLFDRDTKGDRTRKIIITYKRKVIKTNTLKVALR